MASHGVTLDPVAPDVRVAVEHEAREAGRVATRLPPPPRRNWGALAGQAAAALIVVLFLGWLAHNVDDALARRNINVDFGFLLRPAGFDIPFRLAPWQAGEPYGKALLVAGLNTALASALAIALATLLGLVLALLRLSSNPLGSGMSRGAVELIRNTPQLLQIVFWYIAVLQVLPGPRASIALGSLAFLNVRGLFVPAPLSPLFGWIILGGIGLGLLLPRVLRRAPLLLTVAVPLLAGFGLAFATTSYDYPALRGFNFTGGWRLPPELLALVVGVGIYTSAFIAENVRASIEAVSHGQREAARSLGLPPGRTMRLVILPQALRTLLPPLTNHYLNIIKSTTLGAAIAYPEILQIFARTALNQSGRAVEVMTLVLGVFLMINLLVSAAMNRWDRKLQAQGR
ncbi:MAG: ABC transporter permease subunit [Acetobacteraceae bacterium]|nr:ABC transporter permease subunit [Acetobacteraceae bacterium]